MSVATELAPVVPIPEPRRPDADVFHLHPPSANSLAPPVRLTRRGVLAVGAAVALLCAGMVLLAASCAPDTAPSQPPPASVTVRSGDTLWSIATEVAPQRDPRAEVAELRRLNGLGDADLAVGEVLRTR